MTIGTVVERFIVDEIMLGDTQTKLETEASLLSRNILDSLALLRLISFLEEEYNITIEDGEVIPENFETLGQITAFIEQKRGATVPV